MRNIRPPALTHRGRTANARTALALCSLLALTGCGGLANSVVNPMNWFGNSRSQAVDPRAATNPLIPPPRLGRRPVLPYAGQPVSQITDLKIERVPGGALVRVTGLTDVIGYYDVRLEEENEGLPVKGVLSYTLKAVRPAQTVGVGGAAARQVTAATSLTEQELEGVRQITVRGASNQRSSRR
ncbi:MAG: hypothetical protein AAF891_03350 [Pseudomonadota bacterium]